MDFKTILGKIGIGAAAAGATAANVATSGLLTPLTTTLLATLGKVLDPTAKQQLELAAQQQSEQLLALENEHTEKVAAIVQQEMASARAREVAVRDSTPKVLAYTVTLAAFGLLTLLALHAVPEGSREALFAMTGALMTGWIMMMGYYFGSSIGSTEKTALMAKMQGNGKT
ncbi:MAG: hypothetical protein ABSA41_12550 [Terriglobia bacterium]